jgi:hypothetical protein
VFKESIVQDFEKLSPTEIMNMIDQLMQRLISDNPQEIVPTTRLISPMALSLPFVGRNETSAALLNHICHRLSSASIDKSQNTLPYIACCGGLGKSRYIYEQQNALLRYCDSNKEFEIAREYLQNAITANITFHNGQALTQMELHAVRIDNRVMIGKFFAIRVLAACFLPHMKLSDVMLRFLKLPDFDLSLVAEYILKVSQKRMIMIGIDEYTTVLRRYGNVGRHYLKCIVEECGATLCRRDIFAHVLFAGTSSSQFANLFTSSFYSSSKIPMNLLSYEETKQVIDSTISKNQFVKFKGVVERVGTNTLSAVLGGHPRSIEYLFNHFATCSNDLRSAYLDATKDTVDLLVNRTILEINNKYPLGTVNDPTNILCHWALRTPLTRHTTIDIGQPKQTTVDELENEGFVILASVKNSVNHFTIDLPVAWLYDYSSRLRNNVLAFGPLVKIVHILMGKIDWQDLERFALYYYTLRINCAIMLGRTNMSMQDLIGEVDCLMNEIPNKLLNMEIPLPKDPIQVSDKLVYRYPETQSGFMSTTAAQNGDGAAAEVVFVFPSKCDMFIQTKLTSGINKITSTTINNEVDKMFKAFEKVSDSYVELPKIYLILTNLEWPEAVDKIPAQHGCCAFKISRSDLTTMYGHAISGRLLII